MIKMDKIIQTLLEREIVRYVTELNKLKSQVHDKIIDLQHEKKSVFELERIHTELGIILGTYFDDYGEN